MISRDRSNAQHSFAHVQFGFTCVICISDPYFRSVGLTSVHACVRIRKNRHRGVTISAGVRYILAGFVRYGEEEDDDDPFSVYNCSPYGAGAADCQPTSSGSDRAGAERSVPVLSMKAKLEISGECAASP